MQWQQALLSQFCSWYGQWQSMGQAIYTVPSTELRNNHCNVISHYCKALIERVGIVVLHNYNYRALPYDVYIPYAYKE